jgi:hypothetical protein
VAAAVILSLALGVGPAAAASPRPSAAPLPEDPQVLFLQRRCIDRFLGQAAGQTDQAVADQITQRCMTLRRGRLTAPPRIILLACQRPIWVPLAPMTRRVAGCLGG